MTETKVRGQFAGPSLRGALIFSCLLFALGFWAVAAGWHARGQPEGAGREAQTLVSARFIQQEGNFSPTYPARVLGRPWSLPLEFPLYQWTAIAASNLTGGDLAGAGRAVGLLCFYLALPALFLVLRDSGLTPAGGLVVLGAVAGNLFCLNEAAAFQAESMALMFAAWFLAGVVRGLAAGRRGWFWLAILAGAATGVIYGRTLLVAQLLAAAWSAGWFWRHRGAVFSRVTGAWWLAAGLLPWAAVSAWMHSGAGIRQLGAKAHYRPVLGVEGPVFSSDLIGRQLELIGTQVVWWPLLLAGAALAITFSERWWRPVTACTACFFVTRLLFPVVLEQHLPEVMAGTICLLVALGLVLVGLFDPALPRWAGPAGLLMFGAFTCGQIYLVPAVPRSETPANWLGQALQHSVPADAYLVTASATDTARGLPLNARRRTLSLAPEETGNEAKMRAALAAMGNGPLGAVVLDGDTARPADLVAKVAQLTGRELQPAFTYREWTVYLPKAGLNPAVDELVMAHLPEVIVAPGILPDPQSLAGEWRELAKLWRFQRAIFGDMQPAPVSFYSSFGPDLVGDGADNWFNAHPMTRLRFRLPPGVHRLQVRVMIKPGAFDPALPPAEKTDGVEFQLAAINEQDDRRVLHSRLIDPVHNAVDRQPQTIDLPFTLPAGTELEISCGPGPARRNNRDWIYLSRLRID